MKASLVSRVFLACSLLTASPQAQAALHPAALLKGLNLEQAPTKPRFADAFTADAMESYAGMPVATVDMRQFIPEGIVPFVHLPDEFKSISANMMREHVDAKFPQVGAFMTDKINKQNLAPDIYSHLVSRLSNMRGGALPVGTGLGTGVCFYDTSYIDLDRLRANDAMSAFIILHACNPKFKTLSWDIGFRPDVYHSAYEAARTMGGLNENEIDNYVVAVQNPDHSTRYVLLSYYVDHLGLKNEDQRNRAYIQVSQSLGAYLRNLTQLSNQQYLEELVRTVRQKKGIEAFFAAVSLKKWAQRNVNMNSVAEVPEINRSLSEFVDPKDARIAMPALVPAQK